MQPIKSCIAIKPLQFKCPTISLLSKIEIEIEIEIEMATHLTEVKCHRKENTTITVESKPLEHFFLPLNESPV